MGDTDLAGLGGGFAHDASTSGPIVAVTVRSWKSPTSRVSGTTTTPSISGASVTPTDSWLIHEHSDLRTHEKVTFCCRDVVLKLAQFGQALISEASVDLTIEFHGGGALLGRVREEPAPVELGGLDERQQRVMIGLGLPGIPDDEVRSERSIRLPGPDGVDPGEEPLGVAPAAHAAHQRG